jgi:hypothetical protein
VINKKKVLVRKEKKKRNPVLFDCKRVDISRKECELGGILSKRPTTESVVLELSGRVGEAGERALANISRRWWGIRAE